MSQSNNPFKIQTAASVNNINYSPDDNTAVTEIKIVNDSEKHNLQIRDENRKIIYSSAYESRKGEAPFFMEALIMSVVEYIPFAEMPKTLSNCYYSMLTKNPKISPALKGKQDLLLFSEHRHEIRTLHSYHFNRFDFAYAFGSGVNAKLLIEHLQYGYEYNDMLLNKNTLTALKNGYLILNPEDSAGIQIGKEKIFFFEDRQTLSIYSYMRIRDLLKVLLSTNGLLAFAEEDRIPYPLMVREKDHDGDKNLDHWWPLENLALFLLPICKKFIEQKFLTEENILAGDASKLKHLLTEPGFLAMMSEPRLTLEKVNQLTADELAIRVLPNCIKTLALGILTEQDIDTGRTDILNVLLSHQNCLAALNGPTPLLTIEKVNKFRYSDTLEKVLSNNSLIALKLKLITIEQIQAVEHRYVYDFSMFLDKLLCREPGLIAMHLGFVELTNFTSRCYLHGEHIERERANHKLESKEEFVLQFTNTSYSFINEEKRLDNKIFSHCLYNSYSLGGLVDSLKLIDYLEAFHQRHFPDAPVRKKFYLLERKMLLIKNLLVELMPLNSIKSFTASTNKAFYTLNIRNIPIKLLKDYLSTPDFNSNELVRLKNLMESIAPQLKFQAKSFSNVYGIFVGQSCYQQAMNIIENHQKNLNALQLKNSTVSIEHSSVGLKKPK